MTGKLYPPGGGMHWFLPDRLGSGRCSQCGEAKLSMVHRDPSRREMDQYHSDYFARWNRTYGEAR